MHQYCVVVDILLRSACPGILARLVEYEQLRLVGAIPIVVASIICIKQRLLLCLINLTTRSLAKVALPKNPRIHFWIVRAAR